MDIGFNSWTTRKGNTKKIENLTNQKIWWEKVVINYIYFYSTFLGQYVRKWRHWYRARIYGTIGHSYITDMKVCITSFWYYIFLIIYFCEKSILMAEISIKNRNFGQRSKFWSKIQISVPNPKVWSKIEFLVNNSNFNPKSQTEIWILDRNLNFGQKFEFWTEIWILDRNVNFGQKFEFWS